MPAKTARAILVESEPEGQEFIRQDFVLGEACLRDDASALPTSATNRRRAMPKIVGACAMHASTRTNSVCKELEPAGGATPKIGDVPSDHRTAMPSQCCPVPATVRWRAS